MRADLGRIDELKSRLIRVEKIFQEIIQQSYMETNRLTQGVNGTYSEYYVRNACEAVRNINNITRGTGERLSGMMKTSIGGLGRVTYLYQEAERKSLEAQAHLRGLGPINQMTSLSALMKLPPAFRFQNMQYYREQLGLSSVQTPSSITSGIGKFSSLMDSTGGYLDYVAQAVKNAASQFKGFGIIEKNGYLIVKGQQDVLKTLGNLGRRYKLTNLDNYPALKSVMSLGKVGNALNKAVSHAGKVEKIASKLGYAVVGIDTIQGVVKNIEAGETKWSKYGGDAAVDVGSGLLKIKSGGVGAKAGVLLGAKIGAAIGTVVPGAGTVIGGAVGAVVGGIGGTVIAMGLYDKVVNHQIGDKTIKEWVQHGTTTALDWMADNIGKGARAVGNLATDAYNKVKEEIAEAKENISLKFNEAKEATAKFFSDSKNKALDFVDDAKQTIKDIGSGAAEFFGGAIENIGDTLFKNPFKRFVNGF